MLPGESKALLFFAGLAFCGADLAKATNLSSRTIGIDVPAIVVAEEVQANLVGQPRIGRRFVRLRFKVSTYVNSTFQGAVKEYAIQINSPQQTMRVVDFWPRTVTYSDIDGNVSIQGSSQTHRDLKLDVNGGFQPFVTGSLNGGIGSKDSVTQSYQRKAPSRELVNSGTSHRGFGAFFKFRPGPVVVAEGARDIALLLEVPAAWRGDLLQVQINAYGWAGNSRAKSELLGNSTNWLAVHRAGDLQAANQVREFVQYEQRLYRIADESKQQVAAKAMRVAILDYWETQDAVFQLAGASGATAQLLASQ